ncbi:MAG: hemagglutinin repeat-containing protein [Methylocystaceae bacterium]|nr:hemagglutinin repeat-containing protein [Methylocystaceae bacterium]
MKLVSTFSKLALYWILSLSIALQPNLVEASSAVITVAPNSNASVSQTVNNTPLLQIEKPNGAGLSHNKFTDFNVGKSGLVINNALDIAKTNIGGVVLKNPNFTGKAASLILNEVTSANRSSLTGFTEIAGQKADYILANPNGITCNGCGFINTSRSTLTTGTPEFDAAGALRNLSVDGGDVLIEGLGLNADKADAFDIITRSSKLVAQLNANELNIITGRNDVDYPSRTATPKADDGSVKPSVAIDSSALGGMYAGRITLLATEAGVGVNTLGDLAASASDVTITADGKIVVSKVQANQNLNLTSKNDTLELTKKASSGQNISLSAKSNINAQNVSLTSENDLTLNAKDINVSSTQLVAGVDANGNLQAGKGNLTVNADNGLTYSGGRLAAGNKLSIKATSIDSGDSSSGLTSKGALSLEAQTMAKTSGGIISDGDLSLKVTSLGLTSKGALSKAKLNLTTTNFANSSTLSSVGDLTFNVSGSILNNTGATIQSDGTLTLTSSASSVTNRGNLSGKTALNIDAATAITNESTGRLESDGNITLTARGGNINNAHEIEALGDINLTSSANVINASDAKMKAQKSLTTTATGDITNGGIYAAATSQTLSATNLTNTGILKSDGDLTATLTNDLTNSQTIKAQGNLALYVANQLQNNQGTIKGNAGLVIQKNLAGDKTATVENISGTIQAGNDDHVNADLTIRADRLTNHKKIFESDTRTDAGENSNITYSVQYVKTDSDAARILAERDIALYGGDITNSQSQIHANRNLDIAEGNFTNETQELTTTKNTRTAHTRSWKKCKWHGSCKTYYETYYTTASELQADKTQTVFGTLSAHDTINVDVATLALTGVSQGVERVGLVAGDTNFSVNGASALSAGSDIDTSFTVPEGNYGEFITRKGVAFKYLIERNPELADIATFMGSDYFITKTGIDPNKIAKRLGDAAFETDIIHKEIFKRTGKRYLSDAVINSADQMQRLMDAAAVEKTNLNLSFGIELSKAQVAALTSDIIWMVERKVNNETVLVPELYLASVTRDNLSARGGAIVASNINIQAIDAVIKNGRIEGKNSIVLNTTGSLLNRGGAIKSDGNITLASAKDITVQSGVIKGDNINLSASENITVETVNTNIRNGINNDNILNQQAAITAQSGLNINAGRDLALKGAKLASDGAATLASSGATTIETAQYTDSHNANFGNGFDRRREVTNLVSTISAKGDLNLTSQQDFALKGSTVSSDSNVTLDLKGQADIRSAQNTLSAASQMRTDNGGFFGGSTQSESQSAQTTQVASGITAGGNINITAANDLNITASTVQANQDLNVTTAKNINIASAANTSTSFSSTSSSSGFSLGIVNYNAQKGAENDNRRTTNVASTLQGENVTLKTDADLGIKGSTVQANNDATLSVAGNLTVENASDTTETSSSSYASKGFNANIPVYFFDVNGGYNSAKTKADSVSDQTVVASALKAGNDLSASVGKDATIVGSDVQAGNNLDLNVTGNLALATAQNVHNESHSETKESGFTVGVSYAGYGGNVGQSKLKGTEQSTLDVINDGTVLKADQNLNVQAGNITVVSGEITSGADTTLTATQDITLATAQDIHQTSNTTISGTTRTAGVSYGTSYGGENGANVKVGLNVSKGTQTTKTTTQTDTLQKGTALSSGNNITITSGNDTTLVNADVKATGQTEINAGGDVNLLAAADTRVVTNTTATTKTNSIGATVGVSANIANDGRSTDGSFTTGTLNAGLTRTTSKTDTTSTTTTTTTQQGTTIRSDGGTTVVAANTVDVENTTSTGDVLNAGDTVNAGGAVNETTLEDTSKTVTTTTSTSSTSTNFSGPDLKQAALDTVANVVGEVGANKIGDLKEGGLDTVSHKVLHAANGAVQGAIKSGGDLDGAAAGAIGAAVGEIVAEVVDDGTATRTNEKGQQVTKVASIAAQIAAGLAGKDTEIASAAATNAVENNYLAPKKLIKTEIKVARCKAGDAGCVKKVQEEALRESQQKDTALVTYLTAGGGTEDGRFWDHLVEQGRLENIEAEVREYFPELNDVEVEEKALQYQKQYLSDLQQSGTRVEALLSQIENGNTATNTLDAFDTLAAIFGGVTGLVKKGTVKAARNVLDRGIKKVVGEVKALTKKVKGKQNYDSLKGEGSIGRTKGYTSEELGKIDPKTKERFDRLNKIERSSKDFTKAGKENVRDINRELNKGVEKCENCGIEVINPQQSKKGVTPPQNEAHVDHIKRKSEGGSGTPDNGQVLCRNCNVNEKH